MLLGVGSCASSTAPPWRPHRMSRPGGSSRGENDGKLDNAHHTDGIMAHVMATCGLFFFALAAPYGLLNGLSSPPTATATATATPTPASPACCHG